MIMCPDEKFIYCAYENSTIKKLEIATREFEDKDLIYLVPQTRKNRTDLKSFIFSK